LIDAPVSVLEMVASMRAQAGDGGPGFPHYGFAKEEDGGFPGEGDRGGLSREREPLGRLADRSVVAVGHQPSH
jgi:hypothetical protein